MAMRPRYNPLVPSGLGYLADAAAASSAAGEPVYNPSAAPLPQGQPDWYTYSVTFLTLAAYSGGAPGAQQTQAINIDASADFFWTQLSYQAVGTYGTSTYTQQSNPVPLAKIMITDGGSSKNLMQFPTYLAAVAGVGGWPYGLRHPRFFARNSLVSVQAQSFDATAWAELTLYFGGFRVYPTTS